MPKKFGFVEIITTVGKKMKLQEFIFNQFRFEIAYFFSISKIDDVNMEYSVQLTFRESWVDGRLAYGYPRDNKPDFLILPSGQQIWMPDYFFQARFLTKTFRLASSKNHFY